MKTIFTFLIGFFTLSINAQDATVLLDKVVARMNSVKDYSVDAHIKADIPLIKVLPVNATLYFKQKDKFKVVSKGIAILPKQGFTDVNALLAKKNSYMAVDGGTKQIGSVIANLVTVIPTVENSEFVLAKLWIDPKKEVILQSEITTRSSGTVLVDYKYGDQIEFGLPSTITFTVDVKKFKMPKSVAADMHNTDDKAKKKDERKNGTIIITLSNYKVNKGISDDFFKDVKKKE
jgi:outer membrane lipoprotein-sorting protein